MSSYNDHERPRPKGRQGSLSSSSDIDSSAGPSRTSSRVLSSIDTPPLSPLGPRTFLVPGPVNPFSPPGSPSGSPRMDSSSLGQHRPASSGSSYPFPASGTTTRSASSADLARPRRPATSGTVYPRPSSVRIRESFTSPPMRPFTAYNSTARLSSKILRERQKSTMLSDDAPPEKPWITHRDPYTRIAYLVTYAMILLGVIGGGIKCFLSWNSVLLLPESNLCLVLNENFDNPAAVFGNNGTFFREVDMSGFGYVLYFRPDSVSSHFIIQKWRIRDDHRLHE